MHALHPARHFQNPAVGFVLGRRNDGCLTESARSVVPEQARVHAFPLPKRRMSRTRHLFWKPLFASTLLPAYSTHYRNTHSPRLPPLTSPAAR